MSKDIIDQQLKKYQIRTQTEEEDALKEILQEIALFALSTTDFFEYALFQGGTALRILYQLPRFSEDLDFTLKKPNSHFCWEKYIDAMKQALLLYGIEPEIQDRSQAESAIQKLFLKDNSIGKILKLAFHHHAHKKLSIKFEIDINPPRGMREEMRYLQFPIDYSIMSQDLPSQFAGKCHALLCRPYLKGRDWFDFAWYVSRKIPVNITLLKNAILQQGPWKNQITEINTTWLLDALTTKIKQIEWKKAMLDVERFVNPPHKSSLLLWNVNYFLDKVEKLKSYL